MFDVLDLLLVIVIYLALCVHLNLSSFNEEYLKVHFFPVGNGEATIIECHDNPNDKSANVSLTLINAGSMSSSKNSLEIEYFKFLYSLLSNERYNLDNVILTNSNPKYYNFLEPFVSAKQNELKRIRFYVGGRRTSYLLDEIFSKHDFVYEFTRHSSRRTDIHSCGHYSKNKRDFYSCIKKGRYGVIDDSNEVIEICDKFQISVIASNYELWSEGKDEMREEQEKSSVDTVLERTASPSRDADSNHLVLKVTPTEKSQPSILLGNFENNYKDAINVDDYDYYSLIRGAHDYHTKTKNNPSSLGGGLASTLVSIPQLNVVPKQKFEDVLYSNIIQPSYVLSNGDVTSDNSPSCESLSAIDRYLAMFSTNLKSVYQCQARSTKRNSKDATIQFIKSSENIYQTNYIDLSNSTVAEKRYYLFTYTMTPSGIGKPIKKFMFKENYTIPVNVRVLN